MTIKTKSPVLTLSIFIVMLMILSCQSHEQKTDGAFELVKEEKLLNKDSQLITDEPLKVEAVKKAEYQNEWDKYVSETEKKILSNETKIKAIKSQSGADAKLYKKAAGLEIDNNNLRIQMNAYGEEVKLNFLKFREKMNIDVNAINSDLNDLTVTSKK